MTREEFLELIPGDKIMYRNTSHFGGKVYIIKEPYTKMAGSITCLHDGKEYYFGGFEHIRKV